jgi:hypothetical protein
MARKIRIDPFSPAVAHLSGADPNWARQIARIADCGLALSSKREPYEALIRAIAHQQQRSRTRGLIGAPPAFRPIRLIRISIPQQDVQLTRG